MAELQPIPGGLDKIKEIQALHEDLLELSESRLPTIDRLCAELDAHVEAFKQLLDHKPKNEESRSKLKKDEIKYKEFEFSINDEFREQATQIADSLSLDEVEAAVLLIEGIQSEQDLDRPAIPCAIIRFHEYRTLLVDSFRLLLHLCLDVDIEDELRAFLRDRMSLVLENHSATTTKGTPFTQKCIATMSHIEQWLNKLAEQVLKFAAVGQAIPDHDEVMGIQQNHLTQQHESLGTIIASLVKFNSTSLEDLRSLLDQMRQVDKWNSIAIHYVPSLISFFGQYGSANGSASHNEARTIHRTILDSRDSNPWPLRNLQAAATIWWLSEYNSWYFDMPKDHVAIEDEDSEKEELARADALAKALQDGAFQCILSICSQIKSSEWYDPGRIELIRSLLNDAPILPFEPTSISSYFREAIMEHFEMFSYSFIAHMPDTLRRFKMEEEDQRIKLLSGFPTNLPSENERGARHLERFFVIMSYAYEDRPEAANEFWADTDSNLYGFLQWFSRRVSTPVVGAFCEMFRAISNNEDCAVAAHHFLLDGGTGNPGRARRSANLSWTQIFEELEFYASKVRESPTTSLPTSSSYNSKSKPVDADEPETPAMLECYLRLVAHLCQQSEVVKSWVVSHASFKIIDTAFLLCNNAVPSRIRACAYNCIRTLLSKHTPETTNNVWTALDQWVSNGFSSGGNMPRPAKVANSPAWAEEMTFEAISNDFNEMDAFVNLLTTLISTTADQFELHDLLPFPENLGASYRMPGIDPYIDLVLGKVFATKLPTLDLLPSRILSKSVFSFIETSLDCFNEDLILLAHRTKLDLDGAINASSLLTYVRLHPFSRIIEWMFNEKVIAVLFSLAHQDINEIHSSQADSPLILTLLGCIRAMNSTMDLQSTYLDIVRPLVKTQSSSYRKPVANPSLASFEDAVSMHLRIITDLAYYSTSGQVELAFASTELLKKFSMSRKLNGPQSAKIGSRVTGNRLVGILQGNDDVEPIAKGMARRMQFDERELGQGPSSMGFRTKHAILDLLEQTLSANPDQPNLAHALLGFVCNSISVQVEPASDFAQQNSLFHAVLDLYLEYPELYEGAKLYWTSTLRGMAGHIINILWTSPLTSGYILPELRELRVLTSQWCRSSLVGADTIWENGPTQNISFFFEDGSRTFELYIKDRYYMYSLAAADFRLASAEHSSIWSSQLLSTMLGATIVDGTEIPNVTVFDMLDICELEIIDGPSEPNTLLLEDFDLSSLVDHEEGRQSSYNLKLLDQLFALKISNMRKVGGLPDQAAEERVLSEKTDVLGCFNGLNNISTLEEARFSALRAWSDLVVVLVRNCSSDSSDRAAMALQALQTVSPKLEFYATLDKPETQVFATLVQNLLGELDSQSTVLQAGRAGEIAREKLLQLFKVCMSAIGNPDTSTHLHECFYSICYRYLTTIAESSASSSARSRLTTQTIKAAGDGVIDMICEDAYGAAGTNSIAAILLLDALARLANADKSDYVIESLVRSNFISVLVETIQDMPSELSRTASSDLPLLLAYYKSKLSLLLTLSSTRSGANHTIGSGLFPAVRASGLFAVDPDFGFDLDLPSPLTASYTLLLSLLRVLVTATLQRGPHNQHTVDQARAFLADIKPLMLGVFKRESRAVAYERRAGEGEELEVVLGELVDGFVVLMEGCGFLEFEDETDMQKARRRGVFS